MGRSIINEGSNEFLTTRSPLYIAGVPDRVGVKSLNRWHLRNATSFNGCIKQVTINDKLSDFLQAAKVRHKVSPGCSRAQDDGSMEDDDPCAKAKCKNGATCIATATVNPDTEANYKCRCRGDDNYHGAFCHLKRKSNIFIDIEYHLKSMSV